MNQEKLKYVKPQIEIYQLNSQDILTTSGSHSGKPGIDLPIDPFKP